MASQDWPEVTKYAGLVSAQAHRQELIQDLFKTWQDPAKGTMSGGMIKYDLGSSSFGYGGLFFLITKLVYGFIYICSFEYRELLISFRRSTGQKPQRIIFYRHRLIFCLNYLLPYCHLFLILLYVYSLQGWSQ